jgi:diaminopimelate decarboxylase
MDKETKEFLIGGISADELAREFGTPLYVYEEEKIRSKVRALREAITYPALRVLYACKANSNLEIMRILHNEGCGIDAVSPGEVFFSLEAGFAPEEILFTGCGVSDSEMRDVRHFGILINIDSLSQIERYGRLFPNTEVCVRINPAVGLGAHKNIITGGPESKFGIYQTVVDEVRQLCARYNLQVIGAHIHVGSNILEVAPFIEVARKFLQTTQKFNGLRFIDFGGGLGVPYRPAEKPLNLKLFGRSLSDLFSSWCKGYGRNLEMVLEIGRFFVAEAGHLLVRAVTVKETPKRRFVVTDSGFNHLIRPVLYDAYHEIINVSNPRGKKQKVTVVGNICEAGDFFAKEREIPAVREGDLLLIENAGAYCFSMASSYNGRPLPAEILVSGGKAHIVRSRETPEDLIRTQKRIIKIATE